jgi:hypothetical protein
LDDERLRSSAGFEKGRPPGSAPGGPDWVSRASECCFGLRFGAFPSGLHSGLMGSHPVQIRHMYSTVPVRYCPYIRSLLSTAQSIFRLMINSCLLLHRTGYDHIVGGISYSTVLRRVHRPRPAARDCAPAPILDTTPDTVLDVRTYIHTRRRNPPQRQSIRCRQSASHAVRSGLDSRQTDRIHNVRSRAITAGRLEFLE